MKEKRVEESVNQVPKSKHDGGTRGYNPPPQNTNIPKTPPPPPPPKVPNSKS